MNDRILRFPSGHFSLARIVYFTDLRRSDSPIVPIGVVAEVTLNGLTGIGTALRPTLDDSELHQVGPWMREALRDPMRSLWPEMEKALITAPSGTALQVFSALHQSSLSVLSPQALDVPKQWLLERDYDALKSLVSARLNVTLTEQYYELLFPPRGDVDQQKPRVAEEVRMAA
jgi:hypothetical protein